MGGAFLGVAVLGATALIAWLSYHFGQAKGPEVFVLNVEQKQEAKDPAFSTSESGSEQAQADAARTDPSQERADRDPSGAEGGAAFLGFENYQTINRMTADPITLATQETETATSERDQAVGAGDPNESVLPWSSAYQGGPVE